MEILHKQVLELHTKGLNDAEIAKIVGKSKTHIAQIRKFHLNLPPQSVVKNSQKLLKIRESHELGLCDREIGEELGLANSTVQRLRADILNLKAHFTERTYETEEDRIKGYMIRNIKFSAKRRGLEFNLDYQELELPEYCPLLEIKLSYRDTKGFNSPNRATIDRINNNYGYVSNNVWVISRLANVMKSSASMTELKTFAKNLYLLDGDQRARGGITDS